MNLRIEPISRSDDHNPRMSPPKPPSSASTKPSLRSWRTIRHLLPPRARRIAISFRREVPLASNMFARLRQATRSTTTAIPSNNGAIGFTPLAAAGFVLTAIRDTGAVMNVWFFCSTGYAFSKLAASPSSAGLAGAAVTPGFSRPMMRNCVPLRSSIVVLVFDPKSFAT